MYDSVCSGIVLLSESKFSFLDFLSSIKIVLSKNLVLGKKIVSTCQFFVFVDICVNRRKLVNNKVVTSLMVIATGSVERGKYY